MCEEHMINTTEDKREKLAEKILFLTGKQQTEGISCFEQAELNVLKGGLENGRNKD